jgi:VirE N-terminal domain
MIADLDHDISQTLADSQSGPLWNARFSYFPKATATKNEGTVTLAQILREIQGPKHQRTTAKVREELAKANGDKKAAAVVKAKLALAGVPVSARVPRKRKEDFVAHGGQHTGFVQADFDNLPDRDAVEALFAKLAADPHVALRYHSATLTGCKAFVRVEPPPFDDAAEIQRHHEQVIFPAVSEYCQRTYGLTIDQSCSDITRFNFFAHDPQARANFNAAALPVEQYQPSLQVTPMGAISPASTMVDRTPPQPTSATKKAKLERSQRFGEWASSRGYNGDLCTLDLGKVMSEAGIVRRVAGNKTFVACPWESEHSSGSSGTDVAVLHDPQASGFKYSFKCQHDHCTSRTILDFVDWLEAKQPGCIDAACEKQFNPPIELPQIYYAGKGGYAIAHNGGFIPLTAEGQVAQHLRASGVEKHEVSALLCRLRLENFVSYIGPVAGHPAGIYTAPDSGQPFLVTSGPRIIEGREGKFPFIADFLADLLGKGEQAEAVMAWLRQARRNVIEQQRRPLPAAILVGSKNCGKTLFIEITRQILGGRSASAFAALSGNTDFNGDIIGAELLVIDDEIASRDHRARTALAQGIKKYLFASHVRAHSKFREAVNMRPVHAVAIAVNDEPEHLQVLPAIDDSVADKISLFACNRARLDGLDDREEIGRRIAAELPAFVHHLDSTEHPDYLRNQRTGAAAWQSREVLERLQSISPEEHLRELMTQCSALTTHIELHGYWVGTAAEMEQLLRSDQVTQHSARSLLSWNSACGAYLAKLMTAGRCEITKTVVRGNPRWRIASLEPVGASQSRLSL